jgi:hypothetical protein
MTGLEELEVAVPATQEWLRGPMRHIGWQDGESMLGAGRRIPPVARLPAHRPYARVLHLLAGLNVHHSRITGAAAEAPGVERTGALTSFET